jgi:hypothetical protein
MITKLREKSSILFKVHENYHLIRYYIGNKEWLGELLYIRYSIKVTVP